MAVVSSSRRPRSHRGDRARGGRDRAAAVLGADARVRGLPAELGLEAVVRRRGDDDLADRRRVVEDVAEARTRSCAASKAFAPGQRPLLADGEQRARAPTGEPSTATRWASASSCGDRGLVVGAEDRVPGALPAAVDEHRLDRRPRAARCRGARTAGRSGPSAPGSARAGCRTRSRSPPRRRPRRPRTRARSSSPRTRAPIAPSRPDGLGIAQSSANGSLSRRRSTSEAGRTASATGSAARTARTSPSRRPRRRARSQGGGDELAEQRRGPLGARLELGVELRGDEERVVAPAR